MLDAIELYRKSYKCNKKGKKKMAKIYERLNYFLHNSYIPRTAFLGEGTTFAYGGISVVLHDKAIMGKNCVIGQGVTIGGRKGHGGPPVIGDNVFIGAGAKVLGDFNIGNNVTIGVNAVVLEEIPENAIVAGVPAKIIGFNK